MFWFITMGVGVGAAFAISGCSNDADKSDVDRPDVGDPDADRDGGAPDADTSIYECGDGYCCTGSNCCDKPDARRWFCADAGSTDDGNLDVSEPKPDADIGQPNDTGNPDIVESDSGDLDTADIAEPDADIDQPNDTGNPDIVESDSGGDGEIDTGIIDSDGDNIPDDIDNCPATINPFQEDLDGDRVGDACDACPDDANKIELGVCGCGTPETDSDGDAMPDCIDECDNDPAKTEEGVCGCGVPDVDDDNDGLANCIDNCPENHNPDQLDTDGNGVGDACDPNVHTVYAGIRAADLDAFDIDEDGADELVAHGTNPVGEPILLECQAMGATLLCGNAIPFPNDGLHPITYLPQPYGGLSLATDPSDGTPTGIRRFDRNSAPPSQVIGYNFSRINIGAWVDLTYPSGLAAFGENLFFSEMNCPPDPAACDRPSMTIRFENLERWGGGVPRSPFPIPMMGSRITALATTQIAHDLCRGNPCDLLVSLAAESRLSAGLYLHDLANYEMMSNAFIPFEGPAGNVQAYPLPELNLVRGGQYAIVPMVLPEPSLRSVDLGTHAETDVPFSGCLEMGASVTDVAVDATHEGNDNFNSFPVYLAAGGRVVFLNLNKVDLSGEALGYVQLPANLERIAVVGGALYVSTDDDRIVRLAPEALLPLLTLCE